MSRAAGEQARRDGPDGGGGPAGRRLLGATLAAVALAAACAVLAWQLVSVTSGSRSRLVLGVLDAVPAYRRADAAAGIHLAMIGVSWASWEPRVGVTDARYRRRIRGEVAGYRRAGWQVAVDPGLQYPPAWAARLPGALLVGAGGGTASALDFEWSAAVRTQVARYLRQLVAALGRVRYYRVGLNEHGEAHYPDTASGQWWAFGPGPQGRAPGQLPAGTRPTPMPGWVPGQAHWRGRPVSAGAVARWYGWYFAAMVGALRWEIASYRRAGFGGQLQLVVPGTGALPALYTNALAHDLRPTLPDGSWTIETGAVWWKLLADLGGVQGLVLDISSVGDESGDPRGNACRAGDSRLPLRDPAIVNWSDTRWLSYLARRHGMPVVGENPGNTPAADLPMILRLATSCHLRALQWAWDAQLRQPGTADLAQLQQAYGAATG